MANTKKDEVKEAKVSSTKTKKTSSTTSKGTKKSTSVKKDSTPSKAKTTTVVQEENNYGKTLLSGIIILLILVAGFFGYKKLNSNDNKNNQPSVTLTADEKKFKKDYESLNNTKNSNGNQYKTVNIIDNNNIKYISLAEAATMLDEGTGVIYFGFAACPWCRNAVPELLTAMTNTGLDTIYYVNIREDNDAEKDVRDSWELNTRNKPFKKKDADEAYYKILVSLANELQDYVIKSDNNKEINTGEKRLYAPTVVAVLNGEIVGFHEGTIEGHDIDENGVLIDLTKDEEEALVKIYTDTITKVSQTECKDDKGC